MSGCRVQERLAPIAPMKEMEIKKGNMYEELCGDISTIRNRPYPPSFSRTPARIILPATGASTWALGSHRWVIYIGIFTRKANRQKAHQAC